MASRNKEDEKKTKKLQKSYFDVLGICCSSEIPIIENILKSLAGVKEYSVIVPSRTVIVVHDSHLISASDIAKALNQARLEANVKVTGEANFKNKWPNPFAVVSGILLLLSLLKYVYPPLHWLAVAAVAAGIYPILAKAFASIRRFRIDINILAIITVIATLAMQDYMEAASVVFLFTIAEWLESRASYKASAVMQSVMSLAPQKAVIAETGEEVEVEEVKINTILSVKAGETIPIDGIVVDGNCEVDEKTLTGEAFPVPKLKDSTVLAGTINLNGYVTVRTTALAGDCVVAKMAKLVEEAQSSKTKSQRLIDKCSQYYTPAIIIVSGGITLVPVILKVHNLKYWFHLALVVLVSACPCGLILSTPVATFCALTKAATSGLLIKSADYLDTLSKIKIVAFDKTGTITRGEFIVVDFKSSSKDISLQSLLYWVSSVESKSSHPMAATIVDYAKSVSIEPRPEEVEDYQNYPGEGIYGKIDGNDIYIGNKRIGSRAGCSTVPEIEVEIKGGKTVGYIYVGARFAGFFNLSDECRSGVAQAMMELKSMGIKTAMLTGDNQDSAMHAQEQLGNAIDVVHGELLPEDKSKIIQDFKKQGPTAMVGDGINDAPALATANIGISMGISGSALATQTGHIILMSNDIRRIPLAIKIARKAQRKVIENVCLSITLKVGILILAFAGHPLIWAAVLVDVGTCLLVILNSMLLLREKKKGGEKKCYRGLKSVDLEAGLLTNGECKSGCCGDEKKKEKKVVMMGLSGKAGSDHCESKCCGDKKEEVEKLLVRERCCGEKSNNEIVEVIVEKSCCGKPEKEMNSVGDCGVGHCKDKKQENVEMRILGEKSKEVEGVKVSLSSCKKSSHGVSSCCGTEDKTVKEIVVKSCCEKPKEQIKSVGECGSSHCKKLEGDIVSSRSCAKTTHVNDEIVEVIVAKSCCEKPEKRMKSVGNCGVSHCKDKKQAEEDVEMRILGEKSKEVEGVMASLGSCRKSSHGVCGTEDKTGKEIVAAKSCCEKPKPEIKSVGDCGSSHCKKQEGDMASLRSCDKSTHVSNEIVEVIMTKSCFEKPEERMKSVGDCGVSHCKDKKQENVEMRILGHGLTDLEKGHCGSHEKQTGEINLASEEEIEATQICQDKASSSSKASRLNIESGDDCKLLCCENIEKEQSDSEIKIEEHCNSSCSHELETIKVPSQSCCTTPRHLVLTDFQLKKGEHCEASCCEETSEKPEKEETCCKVKTLEACAAKHHQSGKSCCRSYAKEFCSHSHRHGLHHQHHHHHVGAA